MTSALVALGLPLGAGAALAQSAGFAIEVGPSGDPFIPVRVGARVFGPVSEAASSFVRGCAGYVPPENAGVVFAVTERMETLAFTGAGEGLTSMVLGTPDGLYRCALASDQGLAVTQLAGAEPGTYTVWLGAAEGSSIDARLFASDAPVSAIELFGLDVARLGAPRLGRFVFAATADSGRQELALGATLFPDSDMRPLDAQNCWGYTRLDAADAVLTLDQATDRFSLFARSDRDLTMAVVTPSGQVLCNDDTQELNPAVTVEDAQAGDYHVFVGGFSQGGSASYDLFASAGGPAFSDVVLNLDAEPRAGFAAFDIDAAGLGQLLASGSVTANDPMEMLPVGGSCPGFTGLEAPDVVMTLDAPQPMISLYARSSSDLVLAVRSPDGRWQCNDDAFELNPGITLQNAQPGTYHVFVGAYNPGDTGGYNLYASLGSPNWQDAQPGGGAAGLNAGAEPLLGRIPFGPQTRIDPRVIFDIRPSQNEVFGMGEGCAGFIDMTMPDLVISVEAGLPQLMVYIASEADGTLALVGPDGALYCNDDFEQLNPGIMIPNPVAGDYAVFAGTYGGNGGVATLGVTIASPVWAMDREH
ncbi:hypothetical protein [Pararhodobacter sp.]